MHKSIVSVLLLLGAGAALGAVSQRVLVGRAASGLDCIGAACVSKSPASSPASASSAVADARSSTHANVDSGSTPLLETKPMPGPLPQPAASPSAWITPYDFDEAVDIVPMSSNIVVKALTLPAGQYTVQGTLDLTSNIGGLCGLKVQPASWGFPIDVDTASVGAREVPGGDPANEIQTQQRIALQGSVVFEGSGGDVFLVCRADSGSAHTLVQMRAQRPVLSAQLQRGIVLAPP